MMPIGDVGPEIALILAAVAGLLLSSFVSQARQWLAIGPAAIGIAIAAVLCAMQLQQAPKLSFSGTWALDEVAIWARLLILGSTALVLPLIPDWLRTDRRHGEFYSLLLLSAAGSMLLAGAADLLLLSIAVLLSSITGYVLAAYHRDWSISVEAGMKYFLIGAFANTLLMIGITLIFGMLGQTGYAPIASVLAASPVASLLLIVGVALAVVGLAFKMGAVPMHMWMPDVAEGAPAPSAAFLMVVPKIGGVIALARLLTLFPTDVINLRPLIATLAVLTMTLGNLGALWQQDLRRLLGWSSVSQSGYALVAVAVIGLTPQALPALLLFLAGYAAATLAAFAVVTHLRGRTAIDDYKGLGRAQPWAAAVLVIALLSLVGIPPLGGFVGKLMLFLATIDGGYAWLAVVAVGNTAVSLFYYLRVASPIYLDPQKQDVLVMGKSTYFALLAAGASVLLIGFAAQLLLGAFGNASFITMG
jgi:NADH-quinone oxidoreductase subunit N